MIAPPPPPPRKYVLICRSLVLCLLALPALILPPEPAQAQAPTISNFRLLETNPTNLVFAWDAIAGAVGSQFERKLRTETVLWGLVSGNTVTSSGTVKFTTGNIGERNLLVAGHTIEYRLRIWNGSVWTAYAFLSVHVAPDAPTGLSATATETSIALSWTNPSSDSALSAEVQIRAAGGSWPATWTAASSTASHTFSSLTADTNYEMRVRGKNSATDPGASASLTQRTSAAVAAPAAPSALTTSAISTTSITLGWTKSSGATGYKVQRGSGAVTTLGDVNSHTFSSLSAGTTYTLKVIAFNAGGDSPAASKSQITVPAAPSSLTTSAITQTGLTLSWTKSTGASGYIIEIVGGAVSAFGDINTRAITGLSANTSYTFNVKATNAGGTSAAASVSANTLPNAPAAPGNLSASGITKNRIILGWAKSAGATYYEVRRGTTGNFNRLGDVGQHSFTGLAAGTSYILQVRAGNTGGVSSPAQRTASTLPNAPAAPAAPTGLTASGRTKTSITLNWTAGSGGGAVSKFQVRRGSGSWLDVSGGSSATSYSFTGLSAGTSYSLNARAFNSGGSAAATAISVSTLPNAPAAPTMLTTSGITQTSITLGWTKSSGATFYEVRRGTNGAFTPLGDVASYSFTGLSAGTTYTLQVRAGNAGGKSSTAQTSASTNNVPPPPKPAAPTMLTTSAITQTSITLSWTKSSGATFYEVRRGTSGAFTRLENVASYTFTGLNAGTSYTLQVRAGNNGGTSPTAQTSATTSNIPQPSSLTTSGITQSSITLGWTKSSGATFYEVRRGTSGSFTKLGNVTSYTFTGLSASTTYTLQVRAGNSGGKSTIAQTSATTNNIPPPPKPAAPTSLTTSGITQSRITLTWAKSSGATFYEVRRGTVGNFTRLSDVASYSFTGLNAGTTYILQVRAGNNGGTSPTAQTSATTSSGTVDPPPKGSSGSSKSASPAATPTPGFPQSLNDPPPGIAVSNWAMGAQGFRVDASLTRPDLADQGLLDAFDVWGYVTPELEVCFAQYGRLVFLDAAYAPRLLSDLSAYRRDGMTCAQIDRAGTVVLLQSDAPLPEVATANAAGQSVLLAGCRVVAADILNIRQQPIDGAVIGAAMTGGWFSASEKRNGYFKIRYGGGQEGWVSANYVMTSGDCG